jgi:hypothetical protein
MEELGRADSAVRGMVSVPSGFFRDGDDLVIDGSKIFA